MLLLLHSLARLALLSLCVTGLRGLVPPRRLNMQTQLDKLYEVYQSEPDPLRKNMFLSDLQNRNETLFFRLLINHMEEMGTSVRSLTRSQRELPSLTRARPVRH